MLLFLILSFLIRTEFKNEFGCRDITLLKHAMKNINLGGSTVVSPYVHTWCKFASPLFRSR